MRMLLAVLLFASTAAADTVITAQEVISCSVVQADTNYVRLRLPHGGIRMLLTPEVYEIRLADSARVAELSAQLPRTKIVQDAGQVVPPGSVRASEMGIAAKPDIASASDDPVRAGAWMLGGGLSFSALSAAGTTTSSTFSLTPSVSYFIMRGIALGGELSVDLVSVAGVSSSNTSLGMKATGVFGPASSRLFMLAELGFGSSGNGSAMRTTLGLGALAVAAGHLGIPIKLQLLSDRVGAATLATWQFSTGMCALAH